MTTPSRKPIKKRKVYLPESGTLTDAVEIAPGVFVGKDLGLPDDPVTGIVKFVHDPATGQILSVIQGWEPTIRITRQNFHQWRIGGTYETFYKVIRAGFIKTRRVSPEILEVVTDSLLEHLKACEEPNFWTPERRQIYREANWDELRHGWSRENEAPPIIPRKKKKRPQNREDQLSLDFADPDSEQYSLWDK